MAKTFWGAFLGILAAVAVLASLFGLYVLYQSHLEAERLERQMPALRMRTLSTALITYDTIYKGYPERLAQLAPPGLGADPSQDKAGLVDDVLASGKVDRYTIIYTPSEPDRRGRITGFTITATRDPDNTKHFRNFFLDETGVIRSTWEDRPATAEDYPHLF